MKDSSMEISRLCESWWERLADATKMEQQRYAEELLRLLDWELPLPFTPREGALSLSALPFILRARGQTAVIAYFVPPGTLDPPSAVMKRGLDFCAATRALVEEAATMNTNYALITDLYRSYLYDVRSDELLLGADDPKSFNREMAPVLMRDDVERGSLEELRRPPRSAVARQLREWCQHWTDNISTWGHIPEEQAVVAVDRLLALRHLFDHDILRRTKWRLQQRFTELLDQASGSATAGCGETLTKLFHDMWLDWRMDLFEATPELDKALSEDTVSAPLLREFALLSHGKFSIATILESFNCGDPAEKMRVRMVPDLNEERESYLSRQSLDTIDEARIEIDLLEEGYRSIFHWFDRVVALYDRLERDFDAKTYRHAPQPPEMDLFAWSAIDSNRPKACIDKMGHACRQGFGVYYSSPCQYRIARLIFTLHLISKYAQLKHPVDRFPSIERVLMKRPLVLPSERVMNARAPKDSYEEIEFRYR
jgi:hypothetical protein